MGGEKVYGLRAVKGLYYVSFLLPSFLACLNASKAASHLDDATILLHFVCHEAEIRPLMVGKLC
jgi:hypothetical protein